MRSSRSLLRIAVPAAVALMVIEAAVSIVAKWPAQFGGPGDKQKMLSEFVSHGTVLSPPLFIVIAFALVALVVQRSGRWGLAAVILLVLLAAIGFVGSLGEALAAATPDVPRAVQIVGGLVDALVCAVLFALAIAGLVRRGERVGERATTG